MSGVQVGTAAVSALPSVPASRIAVIGRHFPYRYFESQTAKIVSATLRSTAANIRALSLMLSW